MPLRSSFLACVLAVSLASVAVARAQDDDTGRAAAVMETRVRMLHDRLRITDAQQAQWEAVAGAMMANARHMATLHDQFTGDPPSAPAELRRFATVAQAHADDVQRMVGPFEQLYAAMSPDQQKTADATFREFEHERMRKAGL